jgi:hypothetical protein
MKAFQILNIKDFMKELLVKESFDTFRVPEFSVTTNVSYSIDGEIRPEFYTQDAETATLPTDGEVYTSWASIKPFGLSIIKGKQTPLCFKIVFSLAQDALTQLLADNHIAMNTDDIFGLYLNCQYENHNLMCVTGTSLRLFSMDKTLDHAWDREIHRFLEDNGFTFQEM